MNSERARQPDMAYTVATLAERWDCSEGVIRKEIAAERLGCFRVGALIRIPATEVERFEQCQLTQSNASEADSPSFTETPTEIGTESGFEPPIVLGLKRRHGAAGQPATVHRGPWVGS